MANLWLLILINDLSYDINALAMFIPNDCAFDLVFTYNNWHKYNMRVYKNYRAGGCLDFPYERSEWSNLGRKTDNSMALVFLMLVHYKYNVEPRSWNQSESTVGVFFFVLSCVEFGLASLFNLCYSHQQVLREG